MWKFLYSLASPKNFYTLSGKISKIAYFLCFVLFSTGIIWGLFFAPVDYQQGDAYRIIFIHVPSAFLSMSILGLMTFWAVLFTVWRIKVAGIMLKNAAVIGAWMTFLALVTGAIWGKPMWGTWWIWDARLTSELVLLFIYISMLALFHSVSNYDKALRLMAYLTFIGVLDLPIIHYSVYWWNTLHQGQTLTVFEKPKIASSMLYPLLIMIVAFMSYFLAVVLDRARNELLWRDKKSRWVKALVEGDSL